MVKAKNWPINLRLFNSLKTLREAVINYKEDPKSYETYENKYKARNAVKAAFSENMEQLEDYYGEFGATETI